MRGWAHLRTPIRIWPAREVVRRAALALAEAEAAYFQGRWSEAGRIASAAGAGGALGDRLELQCLTGLSQVRQGRVDRGAEVCRDAVAQSEKQELALTAAADRLLLAEALRAAGRGAEARTLAQTALAFFEPRSMAEAVWRCQRILGNTDAERAALAQFRGQEGATSDAYLARPDLHIK
jgi:hypothetical protein